MRHKHRGSTSFTAILIASGLALPIASCLSLSTDPGSSTSSSSGMGGSSSSGGDSSSSSSSSGVMSVCGNAMQDAPEECDDGNLNEGDGCGVTCLTEHPEVCPGTPIHLNLGEKITIMGTTVGATDKFLGAGNGAPGNCTDGNWTGPDVVYQVIPSADATLSIEADTNYLSSYVHARSACPGTKNDTLGCVYGDSSGIIQLSFPVQQGMSHFVAVDSFNDKSGQFLLTLSLE